MLQLTQSSHIFELMYYYPHDRGEKSEPTSQSSSYQGAESGFELRNGMFWQLGQVP